MERGGKFLPASESRTVRPIASRWTSRRWTRSTIVKAMMLSHRPVGSSSRKAREPAALRNVTQFVQQQREGR